MTFSAIDLEILLSCKRLYDENLNVPQGKKYEEIVDDFNRHKREIIFETDKIVRSVKLSKDLIYCEQLDVMVVAMVKERPRHSLCMFHAEPCPNFLLAIIADSKSSKNCVSRFFFEETTFFRLHKNYEITPMCGDVHIAVVIRDVRHRSVFKFSFGTKKSPEPDIFIHVFLLERYIQFQWVWADKMFPPRRKTCKRKSYWLSKKGPIKDDEEKMFIVV